MAEKTAHELLTRHNVSLEEVRERKIKLHHLRHMVRTENLPFDVFQALVKLRR